MTVETVVNPIQSTIQKSFTLFDDGYWYPTDSGTALVRIQVDNDEYRIFRRRYRESEWVRLVSAPLIEFNPGAFEEWVARWPLTDNT